MNSKTLVSGFAQGDTKPALLGRLVHKTLVLKEFTEIIEGNKNERDELFSQLRGIYDCSLDRVWGNRSEAHFDHSFAMVCGVTHAIEGVSKASMGERTLRFIIPRATREQQSKVLDRVMDTMGRRTEMYDEIHPIVTEFLDYAVDFDKAKKRVSSKWRDRIKRLAELIAILRCTVPRGEFNKDVIYRPVAELPFRLAIQLMLNAMMLTEVNRKKFDKGMWKTIAKLGLDTAHGWGVDIIAAMMRFRDGTQWIPKHSISELAELPSTNANDKINDLIFMGQITEKLGTKVDGDLKKSAKMVKLNPLVQELWMQSVGSMRNDSVVRSHALIRRRRKKVTTRGEFDL
jgi:hypothetical protein